jgi:hypothetical protein
VANEIRARGNLVAGTLSVALLSTDTTMSSAGLANLPAITASNHAVLICENEIMWVTAHTAAATTATILRGQEGTTAAAHALNTAWVHGPVASDFDAVLGYTQVTANQTPITTEVALTGLSLTVTVPYAQHRVRITAQGKGSSSNIGDRIIVSIKEGATYLFDGVLDFYEPVANGVSAFSGSVVIVPTAGTHTYNLTARVIAGAGTMTFQAGTTAPAWLMVEDLGPAL